MDIMQTGTVLAIVVITYLIGAAAKLISHIKDEYIPVIVGVAGGVLGRCGYVPDARLPRPGHHERNCNRNRIGPVVHWREPGLQAD